MHESKKTAYLPHPWHGVPIGEGAPAWVRVYVEITPFDPVKYEIDKSTGFLQIDRPQRTSSLPPAPYGFIPRTLASERVGRLMPGATGGDLDPLDIMVLSERPISRPGVLLTARVVGGIPVLDGGLADDKILAVLKDDPAWGDVDSIEGLPADLIARYRHYFETYKSLPGEPQDVEAGEPYGREAACDVIRAAMADYADTFDGE